MQDALVITVALAAALWLGRTLWQQLRRPTCGPPAAGPAGTDGFVPLDTLSASHKTKPGRSAERPGP
jgi:hypothetical protein